MAEQKVTLRKNVLGLPMTTATSVGLVVCATTLMMVCFGFAEAGPAFFLSMIGAGVIVLFFALTISELAVAMPKCSSMGEYAREAFGPVAGIWQGIMYFMVFTGLAAEATLMGQITELFWPALNWMWYTFIFIAIFYVLNLLGIAIVGWTQLILTIVFTAIYGIAAIIQFAGGGIEPFSLAAWGTFAPAGWGVVGVWLIVALWLYAMVECPAPLIEEIKNPAKNVPRAMMIALGIIFALQALIGFAAVGTLGIDKTFETNYPFILAGKAFFGSWGQLIFSIAALAAVFATFNAVMASTARVLYGLGADGYLGKVIGYLHPRFRTPWVTLSMVFVFTLIIALLAKSPLWIAAMDSFLFCLTYFAVCIYAIRLRWKRPDMERPFYAGGPFKLPIVPLLGAIGTALILFYTIYFDFSVFYVGASIAAGVLVVAFLIWEFYAKNKMATK